MVNFVAPWPMELHTRRIAASESLGFVQLVRVRYGTAVAVYGTAAALL